MSQSSDGDHGGTDELGGLDEQVRPMTRVPTVQPLRVVVRMKRRKRSPCRACKLTDGLRQTQREG